MSIAVRLCAVMLSFTFFACTSGGGDDTGSETNKPESLVYYVSDDNGDDINNDGKTPRTPLKTIHAAVQAATSGDEIRVAVGTYNSGINNQDIRALSLDKSFLLKGGYAADFSSWDPQLNVTTIFNAVIILNPRTFSSPIIEGFVFDSGSNRSTNKIILSERGSPIIRNNRIIAVSGTINYGIVIWDGSPLIENNSIEGAYIGIDISNGAPVIRGNSIVDDSTLMDIAIRVRGGTVTIENNVISSGFSRLNSTISRGIQFILSAGGLIKRNLINGGVFIDATGETGIYNNVIYGGSGDAATRGVSVTNGDVSLYNNTISGGNGTHSVAVSIGALDTTRVKIDNNLLFADGVVSYCVDTSRQYPLSVRNNNFFNCGNAPFHTYQTDCATPVIPGSTCTLAEMEALANDSNIASGNIQQVVEFEDLDGVDNNVATMTDNNWRLTVSSPIDVRQGGMDLSSVFSIDMDGTRRTAVTDGAPSNLNAAGWSMGAYEFD